MRIVDVIVLRISVVVIFVVDVLSVGLALASA